MIECELKKELLTVSAEYPVVTILGLGNNDAGVSATTIKHWIEVLKASFVIFELLLYFENKN